MTAFLLFYFDELVFPGADAQLRGGFDGMDTVAAFDPLQQVGLSGVGAGIHQVQAGLVDGHRVGGDQDAGRRS